MQNRVNSMELGKGMRETKMTFLETATKKKLGYHYGCGESAIETKFRASVGTENPGMDNELHK